MRVDKRVRDRLRTAAAQGLLASLEGRLGESIARLEATANRLKAENPDLAERVDWVMGQVIERAQRMPEAVTALYLVDTQEPPDVIEGEVVEVTPRKDQPRDASVSEVGDDGL